MGRIVVVMDDAATARLNAALRRGWHAIASSQEVTDRPGQFWLLDEPWMLVRDAMTGAVRAFADRCPHRLAPLSAGTMCADGTLQCAYHGWRFGADGVCTLIPALGPDATLPPWARLTLPAAISEQAGIVWLAPDTPLASLPDFTPPEGATVGALNPSRATVEDPADMIDNFLDVAHFPFVHAATFGVEGSDVVDEYVLDHDGFGFVAVTEHDFANHEDPGVKSGIRPLRQRRRMTYTYAPPYTATLRLDYIDAEGTNLIVFTVQPERGGTSRVYTVLLRNDVPAEAMPDALAFEQRVLDEDLAIKRRERSRMPLDLTVEVHTKADRLTIELRRCLARFLDGAGQPSQTGDVSHA